MHKKYVLQSGNLFLEKTYHYGYTMGNQPVKSAPEHEQKQIKNMLVKIDFVNGDVRHFLKHLAGAIAI